MLHFNPALYLMFFLVIRQMKVTEGITEIQGTHILIASSSRYYGRIFSLLDEEINQAETGMCEFRECFHRVSIPILNFSRI